MFGRHSSTATAPGDTVVEERDGTLDTMPVDTAVDEPTVGAREREAAREGAQAQADADSTRRIPTLGRKRASATVAAPDRTVVTDPPTAVAPVVVTDPATVTEPMPVVRGAVVQPNTVVGPDAVGQPDAVAEPVVTEPVVAEPVEPKRWVHVSMVASLSTIVGVAAMGATLTGLLAPLGFAAGVLALLLGLLGMYSVARPNVTGHGLIIFGLVLGAVAVVLSVLAMNGELSWLSSKTDEIAKVHGWLNEHMHWLRRY
jgi:hypothetical protein